MNQERWRELGDGDLVTGCRRGEEAAWEELVRRYQRLVYSVPRRAGLNKDLSADVFQEVFTALIQYIDQINQPERIQAWLVTTARRKTWQVVRRLGGAQASADTIDSDAVLELPGDEMPTDEFLERAEEQHRVRSAVDDLDDKCRGLVTLLYYSPDSPSYAEVAASLKVPEGSVGPTRARCLRKLLHLLNEKA